MARPTSTLPQAGLLADFASDLREFRSRAGEPSLTAMAQKGACSTAALSTAMSGRKLPSEIVLRAFLAGCDCDDASIDRWLARRDELAQLSYEELTQPTTSDDSEAVDTERKVEVAEQEQGFLRTNLVPILLIGVIVFALGGGVGFGIGRGTAPDAGTPEAAPAAESITDNAKTGDDPVRSGCTRDAILAVSVEQADGTLVQIMWSEACLANWGRITRADNLVQGNEITVVLTGHFANAPNPIVATGTDHQTVYTPIMVIDPTYKVCVTGSWTVGEETVEVTEPVCA